MTSSLHVHVGNLRYEYHKCACEIVSAKDTKQFSFALTFDHLAHLLLDVGVPQCVCLLTNAILDGVSLRRLHIFTTKKSTKPKTLRNAQKRHKFVSFVKWQTRVKKNK